MKTHTTDERTAALAADLAAQLGIPKLVESQHFQAALDRLIPHIYGRGTADTAAAACLLRDGVWQALRAYMGSATHPPRTPMKFGTSGWRGLLGDDFTVANVMRVTQGLVDVLLGQGAPPLPAAALGVSGPDEVRRRGCVLAHDTRIMGPELAMAAARVLLAHDIPVIYLGIATTPEVSAAIGETDAAVSINLTPSHNPYFYQGYKFNPRDGGPATAELTAPITRRANQIIDEGLPVRALSEEELLAARAAGRLRHADPVQLYRQALSRRLPFLDLARVCQRINESGTVLYIDNGFGATTGKYERLLADVDPRLLRVQNPAPDFLFGGQSREPSPAALRELQGRMTGAGPALGILNDGDGDRFLGGGRQAVLPMNRFGALVVRYLTLHHGLRGDVTRSLMTSHMADAAQRRYQPQGRLHETRVGFQYLKATVATSVNSWEESDGMSPMGWLRDKDGLLAALLLCAMVQDLGESPEQLDSRLTEELGTFRFERRKIVGRLAGAALSTGILSRFERHAPGHEVDLGGTTLRVERLNTSDGCKLVFDNGWWVGVRASGTEPAARIYAETYAPPGAAAAEVARADAGLMQLLDWAGAALGEVMG